MVERNFFWILAYSILVIAKVLSTLIVLLVFMGFVLTIKIENMEYILREKVLKQLVKCQKNLELKDDSGVARM